MDDHFRHGAGALPVLFRLIAALPLPLLQGTGRVLGRLAYAVPGQYRERLRANAAIAGYPDAAFARRAAGESGAMIMELPRVWFRTRQSVAQVVTDDWHVVQGAIDDGRGIFFLTPHLGCFEITARYTAQRLPLTVMFRPPRKDILAPLLDAARGMSGLQVVPATSQGVRAFVRALRQGNAVGLLPDQAPSFGDGVWVPFFGRMAYTMTLPGKLAAQTGVPIVLAAGERLPNGRGWRMHYVRLPEPLPPDAPAQAALLNAAMEALIRRFPQQYLWSYNRYKAPPGAPPAPLEAEPGVPEAL
ncbi:lysophospholipid acyltransferase family protein [Cupriavidus sp. 2TAF22]|uniref:lysophospholipid acyltransferase family protein n=1 Tax=unclassified Cupriavidus TaxID=2640874 RepID=UPI003F8DAFAB